MREDNLNRINTSEITSDNPYYLHYRTYHEDLLKSFQKYAKGKLLDIGCGNKPYEKNLSLFIESYLGCDIVQSSEQKVDILCNATQIPLPDESFDTIISTQTIEHIAEHQLIIEEAYRLLKKNGYFILSGPMYWPLHEEPYDFFRFTKYGFKHILEKAGFVIKDENANGGQWALCGQVLIHTLYSDANLGKFDRIMFYRRIVKMMGGVQFLNKFFLKMDTQYPNKSNTMNYVFVAEK